MIAILYTLLLLPILAFALPSENLKDLSVTINKNMPYIETQEGTKQIIIKRIQDPAYKLTDDFTKTSRPCPPFCIQPMTIASGVETVAELEVLDYLQQSTVDDSVLIVDSRIKEWVDIGTIPSAKHVPWTSLTLGNGTSLVDVIITLKSAFDVKVAEGTDADQINEAFSKGKLDEILDFSNAKTLVLFCNGSWCGQTPEAVLALLELSYPAEKLKYYREGMQGWLSLGLTTLVDKKVSDGFSNSSVEPICLKKPRRVVSSVS
jgi:hypothetical protein